MTSEDPSESASPDRVFLDANVLFSAAYREDSGLARLWELEGVVLLSSHYAVEEARRNLPPDARGRLAELVATVDLRSEPASEVRPLPEEVSLPANDERILRGAIAARATHLLTGDRKAFGRYYGRTIEGVSILRPADFLRGQAG